MLIFTRSIDSYLATCIVAFFVVISFQVPVHFSSKYNIKSNLGYLANQ
jgi:hypothetical protein